MTVRELKISPPTERDSPDLVDPPLFEGPQSSSHPCRAAAAAVSSSLLPRPFTTAPPIRRQRSTIPLAALFQARSMHRPCILDLCCQFCCSAPQPTTIMIISRASELSRVWAHDHAVSSFHRMTMGRSSMCSLRFAGHCAWSHDPCVTRQTSTPRACLPMLTSPFGQFFAGMFDGSTEFVACHLAHPTGLAPCPRLRYAPRVANGWACLHAEGDSRSLDDVFVGFLVNIQQVTRYITVRPIYNRPQSLPIRSDLTRTSKKSLQHRKIEKKSFDRCSRSVRPHWPSSG